MQYDENGIVYYIDVPLLKKAREKALKEEAKALDEQIATAERGLSIIKSTEASLKRIQDILDEMRKIAVEAAKNPEADRVALNKRLQEQKREIDRVVASAEVEGVNLLDGSLGNINDIIEAINKALNN